MTDQAKVISLVPNRALAMNLDEMATRMEEFAARVRAGEWPDLQHVVITLNDPSQQHTPWVYGKPITLGFLVGVLEFAKHNLMRGLE